MKINLFRALIGASALVFVTATADAQIQMLTNRYNKSRTSANLSETILNNTNVAAGTFGKLGSYAVDGIIYAQPLFLPGQIIAGAVHNVMYVATMHNVVYAFDADNIGSAPLWSLDFRPLGYTPVPVTASTTVVSDTLGILSTPVIDLPNNRMFLVLHSKDSSGNVHFTLATVNIQTGALIASAPITASVPASGSVAGVSLTPASYYDQRAALELADGQLWIGFASLAPGDAQGPWHGFMTTYNPNTLAQTGVFAMSRSNGNSIWQSGIGPVVDASGNVFFTTGNGNNDYDGVFEFPESLMKMNFGTALSLLDWYTPDKAYANDNYQTMNNADLDLSVCGPLLIPGTDLIALGSKTADVFLLHSSQPLGHLTAGDTQLAQFFHAGTNQVNYTVNDSDRIVGMAYWPQPGAGFLYVWPGLETLHSYSFNPSTSAFTLAATGSLTLPGQPASALSVSANDMFAGTGILWAPHVDTNYEDNQVGQPGLLHAYDGATLQELWNSDEVASDSMGTLAKFVPPVVEKGKVYVANSATSANWSAGSVTVFGLLQPQTNPSVSVSLSTAANVYAFAAANTVPYGGGFDGAGYAFSSNLVPAALSWSGTNFTLATSAAPSAVTSTTISLPGGQYSSLNLLASGAFGGGINQAFTVTYSDGTTSAFTQSVSDWGAPQNYPGESIAFSSVYRVTPSAASQAPTGVPTWSIYGYSFPLNPAKTVKSLTLPNNRNVILLSASLTAAPVSAIPGATGVSLGSAANRAAIAKVGAASSGTGNDGWSYAANLLGSSITWAGEYFQLSGASLASAATSTTIPLTAGKYTALRFLGTGIYGPQQNQVFTVTYTDGTTSSVTQSLSDWSAAQNFPGESVVKTMPYRITPAGGTQAGNWNLYGYTIPLNSAKTVQSLTLPNNQNVLVLSIALTDTAAVVNLPAAANLDAIANNGTSVSGIGSDGYAYSSNLLGSSLNWGGQTYTFGSAGSANAAAATTLTLPSGSYKTLSLLGTGIYGHQQNQVFTVTYTDGTATSFTQSLSDWGAPQYFTGESVVKTMAYRVSPSGAAQNGSWSLQGYSFALNSSKTVRSLSLPNNRNVVVLAVDLIN